MGMTGAAVPATSQAERDAETVLSAFWADAFGQTPVPVDPIKIARQMGIDVFTADLGPDVAGVLFKRGGVPTIHLSVFDAQVRQRFTCAHEIGHFYLRQKQGGNEEYGYVDRRDVLATQGIDADEIYANRFAAALLMPQSVVLGHQDEEPGLLARRFGVSLAAMNIRLANLKK